MSEQKLEPTAEEIERVDEALKHCQDLLLRYDINRVDGEEIAINALAILTRARAAILAMDRRASPPVETSALADAIEESFRKASPGAWHAAGGYLTRRDPEGASFTRTIYDLNELGQASSRAPFQAVPFARPEDAKLVAILHNSATQIIDALRRVSPTAEPVEWQRYSEGFGWVQVFPEDIDQYRSKGQPIRALYSSPPAPAVAVPVPVPVPVSDASTQFSEWVNVGPSLAKAAGCYVGITISPLPNASRARQPPVPAVAVPEGMQLVPIAALKWLNGEGPDDDGIWFGDAERVPGIRGAFWWRTVFNRMLVARARSSEPLNARTQGGEVGR